MKRRNFLLTAAALVLRPWKWLRKPPMTVAVDFSDIKFVRHPNVCRFYLRDWESSP